MRGSWYSGVMTGIRVISLLLINVIPSYTYLSGDSPYPYYPDGIIRITSIVLEPYLMKNLNYHYTNGEAKYIGFIPDLLHEIAELNGMNYVLSTTADNSYGYKQKDGSWDGMIGDLLRKDADVAAGPMYETAQRSEVVDFTIPYLDVHATMLLRKPAPGAPLQIKSVTDVINQSEIKYGTLDRGILVRAFKSTNSSTLKVMWRNMLRARPTVFTKSNDDGISRVRQEKYAFIIPHTIGEYMSMQEPCDLITVDKFLINRGYCLAVNKGSEVLQQLNLAIRTLKESGKLLELYRTWWVGRSQCHGIKPHKIYGSAYTASSSSTKHFIYDYSLALVIFAYLFSRLYLEDMEYLLRL